ncbi:filamentous hemagglutinin N-terminal domain-containing protein [Methylobacter sp. Wu1]|uniref:two-partner secretion domain-containing protein n=1 Tax=Methylobacter sp. Wu1 TaxID=3119359 RepID=UPI002F9336D1
MKTVTDQSPNNNNLKTLPAVIKRLLMAEAVGAIALSCAPMAHANPTGGEVAAGAAEIVQQGARMDINQASQRAVINWQAFSIDNGEHVNFNQPGRDSATLNRVAGNDPSAILGRLTANGSVYLVNRNGIMVGQDAEIDVGSLTATTANISNKDFMEGRMNFAEPGNPDARIINHGSITVQQGGLVALVAPGVENHGTINARLGKIALAGGDAFTLDLYGDQLINLTVTKEQLAQISSAEGKPLSHYVSNTGEIIADGGMVTILAGTGKAIVDSLINLKGHVQAQTVENRNGVITLLGDENTQVEVAGTLDASGQTAHARGGRVEVRGGEVQLAEGSRIDVSGNGQGGTVLIGGDFQGSGEGIRARTTTVERNAAINADSHSAGDGGKVIVWADDHTHFDGAISARGGQSSGNGGLVEVSGKHTLHYDGDVDASAKNGKAGELLLDPGNLIVKTMTVEENKTAAKPDANGSVTATSTDAAVNVQKVNALLQSGTSISLKADNDLTVAAKIDGRQAIDGKTGASISLAAGHDVNINDHIFTNNGDILIKASTGDITMAGGTILSAGNRAITLTAGSDVDLQHLVTTGKIAVTSGANATFKQALTGLNNQGIGEFVVDAGGNAVLNGLLSNSAATVSADGLIDVVKPVFTAGDVNLAGKTLTVESGAGISTKGANGNVAGKALNLTSTGGMTVKGSLLTGNAAINLQAQNGSLTTAGDIAIDSGSAGLALKAGGDISLGSLCLVSGGCDGKADAQTSAAAVITSENGNITMAGNLLADRSLSLTANNGALTLGGIDLSTRTGASVQAQGKQGIKLNNDILTHNGGIAIQSTNGAITAADDIAIDSGSAGLALKASGNVNLGSLCLISGECGGKAAAQTTAAAAITSENGNITLAGDLLADRSLLLTANNGALTLGGIDLSSRQGATLQAQSKQGIKLNNDILTNNGEIAINSTGGAITMADNKILSAGDHNITLTAGGDVEVQHLLTTAKIAVTSGANATFKQALTGLNNQGIGEFAVDAGGNVVLNGLRSNSVATVSADGLIDVVKPVFTADDVNLAGKTLAVESGAGISTKGADGNVAGKALNLTSTGDMSVKGNLQTGNAAINLQAQNGSLTTVGNIAIDSGSAGLAMKAGGDISLGSLCLVSGGCDGKADAQTAAAAVVTSENGNITLAGNLLADRSLVLKANNGTLTLGGIDLSSRQGATLQAQGKQGIKINNDVLTKNGDIAISSTDGAITMADNKILSAGNRNITLDAGGGADLQHLMTTGKIAVTSGANATFKQTLTGLNNQGIGKFTVDAGGNVVLNGLLSNSALTVSADGLVDVVKPVFTAGDVNLAGKTLTVESNADINTKGLSGNVTGKALNLTSTGNMTVKGNLLTGNAAINLQVQNGSLTTVGDIAIDSGSAGLALKAGGNVSLGSLCLSSGECGSKAAAQTTAAAVITSENGNITLTGDLLADRSLLLTANNGALTLGGIDLSSRQGATLQAQSKNAIKLNSDILTNNGEIAISSTDGAITMAKDNNIAIDSGSAELALKADGDISLGSLCLISGKCGGTTPEKTSKVANITSENGNITLAGNLLADRSLLLKANNGALTLGGIDLRLRQGATLQAQSQQNINLNNDILTGNGDIVISSANGAIKMADNKILSTGDHNITLTAGSDVEVQHLLTTAKIAVTSGANATFKQALVGLNNQGIGEFAVDAGGNVVLNGLRSNSAVTVSADGLVDVVKPVFTAGDVNLAGKTLTVESGAGISTKGANGNVAGKALNLAAADNMTVKGSLLTGNAAINLQAQNGSLTTAGDIAIDSGSEVLTLKAGGDISLGSLCLVSGGCDGKADAQSAAAATITSENGNITMAGNLLADRSLLLTANNGALTLGGIDLSSRPGATLQAQSKQDIKFNNDILTNNGEIAIQSTNGAIKMADNTILSAGNQNISLEASGDVHAQHLISTNKIDVISGADVIFGQALTGIQKQGIGDLIVDAAGDVTLNGAVSNGSLTVAQADNISILKPIFTAGAVDFNSKSLDVASGADISTKGADGKHSGSQIKLTTNGNMMLNANLMTGDAAIELKATGMESSITTADNISINSGLAAVNIDADGDINMGNTCLAPGEVCSKDPNAEIGIDNPAMATIISQNGDINIDGSLMADRSLSITASQGKLGLGTIDLSLRELAELQLSANGAIVLNGDVLTENGMLTVSDAGSITGALDKRLKTGTADISLKSEGDVSLYDVFTTGKLDLVSDGSIIFNEALGVDTTYNGLEALSVQGKGSITFYDQIHLTGVNPITKDYGKSDNVLNIQQTGTSGKLTINGKIVVDNGSVYLGKPVGTDSFTDDNNIELGNSIYALKGDAITLNNNVHVKTPEKTASDSGEIAVADDFIFPEELKGYTLKNAQDKENQPVIVLENKNGTIAVNGDITGLFQPDSPLNIAFSYKSSESSVSLPKWKVIEKTKYSSGQEEDSNKYWIIDGEVVNKYLDTEIKAYEYVHLIGSAAFYFEFIPEPDAVTAQSIASTATTNTYSRYGVVSFTTFNGLNDNVISVPKADSQSLSSLASVNGHSIDVKPLEINTTDISLSGNSAIPSAPGQISISPAIKQASDYTKTLETVQVDGHSITVKPTEESTTKIKLPENSASTPEQFEISLTESTLDGLKTLDVPKTNALDPDQTDTSSSTKQTLNYANSLEEGSGSADHPENEESVILGGGSEADNTDLGLNSPETGAVQDTYSTKHSPVCSVNKTNGKSKAGLPHCGNSSVSKS